jgi:hypothetical protein
MDKNRPVYRPQSNRPLAPVPTLIRVPQNTQLFRGWGVTL